MSDRDSDDGGCALILVFILLFLILSLMDDVDELKEQLKDAHISDTGGVGDE